MSEIHSGESDEIYRTLFDSASDAIVISDGNILECNRRFEEMFGYSRADLLGHTSLSLFAPMQANGEPAAAFIPRHRAQVLAGQPVMIEVTMCRRDGSLFPAESNMRSIQFHGKPVLLAVIRDITERKSIIAQENRYRALFESTMDAIVLSDQGKNIECNARSLEIFRGTREDIVGSYSTRFFPEFQPDGSKSVEKIVPYRTAAMAGTPQVFDWTSKRLDGELFDCELKMSPAMVEGRRLLLVVIRDITERKRIEKALAESEERFRQMAESIQEIFFLLDRNSQTVLYMSPIAESILGIPMADLKSRPMELEERMIHPVDREQMGYFRDGACFKREFSEEFRFLHPDGRQLWLSLKSFPIRDASGEVYRVAGSLAEITEYKNTQEAARRQERQLIQADKMSSLGLMVSGAAHEINNPNNLIMLNTDLLESLCRHMIPVIRDHATAHPDWRPANLPALELEQKIAELIAGISGGSQRIKRIVGNLKHFSRTDPGGLHEQVDLGKAVDAAVAIVENLIRKSTDHFSVDHDRSLPRFKGNFQMLEQVIINLLTNACQALERRSQSIRIRTRHDRGTNEIALRVEDEGKGIAPEIFSKIADPFFTTKRDSGGTGLGLSVSYGIIREHGGKIDFQSEVGHGTRVEIRIPITSAEFDGT